MSFDRRLGLLENFLTSPRRSVDFGTLTNMELALRVMYLIRREKEKPMNSAWSLRLASILKKAKESKKRGGA